MGTYAAIGDLRVEIEGHRLEPLALPVSAGWTRHTTVLRLRGGGVDGLGEDVAYVEDDQEIFRKLGAGLSLAGNYTLDEFSRRLDDFELCPDPAGGPAVRMYRRWTFESAALDLALRQAGQSLAQVVGIEPRPLTFVSSTGMGPKGDVAPLLARLERFPGMRFKLDLSTEWTAETVRKLAGTGAVDTVDLKGQYKGSFTGTPPRPDLYRMVVEGLPEAWIEDPALTDETSPILAPHRERLTWDAPIHAVADMAALPYRPRCMNIKPSRFGMLSELFRAYEYCRDLGIEMYGGGQFELGPGRGQIQYLASLFHPDTANDVAPREYHGAELPDDARLSPLPPRGAPTGFRWEE